MKDTQAPLLANIAALRASILTGELGPAPASLAITGASSIYQTTQFPSSKTKYHNYYMLLRVEAAFGACSHTAEQLDAAAAAALSGRTVEEALHDPHLPVQIAAMDAYLGAVFPHQEHGAAVVAIPAGLPLEKARHRDAHIAELAQIEPGQQVALIGVVNPLVEAIRQRGGICLPCDLQLKETAWGDPVEQDMQVVLAQADNVICTGMTLSNGSFDAILAKVRERRIPLTVYAQSGSAAVARFLHQGVTALVAEPFPFTQFSTDTSTIYCYTSRKEEQHADQVG